MLKIGNEVRIRRKKDLLCEYGYNDQEDEPLRPEISYLSFTHQCIYIVEKFTV